MPTPQDERRATDRREQTARLALLGHAPEAIAARLGVARRTTGRDLELLHGEWRAAADLAPDALKARELARLDALEREYWAAWERSVAAHTAPPEAADEPDGRRRAAPKDPAGDPRFLDGVEWCIDRRCRLLGLDAPKRPDPAPADAIKVVAGIDWDAV